MSDFIQIPTDIFTSEEWLSEPFTKSQALLDLCVTSAHSEGVFEWSTSALMKRWKWSNNQVRRFREKLINASYLQVIHKASNQYENYLYRVNATPNATPNDTASSHSTICLVTNNKDIPEIFATPNATPNATPIQKIRVNATPNAAATLDTSDCNQEDFFGLHDDVATPNATPNAHSVLGFKDLKNKPLKDSNTRTLGEKPRKTKRFVKPSLEEVKAYCQERGNSVDAQAWLDHYTSNGWKVGKNSMKDWKAAVRTWERNRGNYGNNNQQQAAPKFKSAQDLLREQEERGRR